MPKSLKSIGLISVFLILSSTALFATEQITITTYYPSPYGVYRELRSQRMAIGETYIKHDTVCWEGSPINCDGFGGQTMIPTASDTDLIVEGRVGIGTTAPNELLEVAGTGRVFIGDGGGASRKGLLIDAVEDGTYVRLHPYNYGTTASMNLVISPFGGGNVGIGTTGPAYKLQVESSDTFPVYIKPNNGTSLLLGGISYPGIIAYGLVTTGSGESLAFGTNGDNVKMIIQHSTGNVGIGTTTPGTNKLEVAGGPVKTTGGLIIETRSAAQGDPAGAELVNGRMWLRTS